MRLPTLIIVLVLSLLQLHLLSGCEQSSKQLSPVSYQHKGLTFCYPESWMVTEDVQEQGVRHIFVEHPGHPIFIILIFSKEQAEPLMKFAQSFADNSRQDSFFVKFGDSTFSDFEKSTPTRTTRGIREEFIIWGIGIPVPHIREYTVFSTKDKTAILISQASVEEFNSALPAFDLLLDTIQLK